VTRLHGLGLTIVLALALVGAEVGAPRPPVRSLAASPPASDAGVTGARPAALTFDVDDPLAPQQWYIERTRALSKWAEPPSLAPVRVAVIDSGIDLGHPELAGRVAAARSFVSAPVKDTEGHGTIVSGVIAAQPGNAAGIAGLAPSAELIVAKVVRSDRSIGVREEARAIRWAVDQGARVINMSLGGIRDPGKPSRDTFSAVEAEAVRYAVRKGVLVVAAVGNGDQAPKQPWPYASYPAALPHVLGVSAVDQDGTSPGFSNRDPIYNDIAAPGVDILSTFPRSLTARRPECVEQGFTLCGTDEFTAPEGTSFAAPIVTAMAANLIATRPGLRPEQVSALLQRSAVDATPTTGCGLCVPGRDALTGWGVVDGEAALTALEGEVPPPDSLEPNDDAGGQARRLFFAPGRTGRTVDATLDYWDDEDDVYAVRLARGQRLFASLSARKGGLVLALWRPETTSVDDLGRQDLRVRLANTPGPRERLSWTADEPGWHFLQVRLPSRTGPFPYRLSVVRPG
jgi:subtilisin family serine protease